MTNTLAYLIKITDNLTITQSEKDDIKKHILSLEEELNMAEIQLIALITAIKGFCSTNPTMTINGFNNLIPSILKLAREAEIEDKKSVEPKNFSRPMI